MSSSEHGSFRARAPRPLVNNGSASGSRVHRTVSEPDLARLTKEWDQFQSAGSSDLTSTQLQVDLLNIRTEDQLKRPRMRVKMGSSQYNSAESHTSTGDWNEGFIFVVSYHAQLFNTIEFDLYDRSSKHWPAKTTHVGKAKLKLSKLKGHENVFIMFLPIFEYHARRYLPVDIIDSVLNTDRIGLTKATKSKATTGPETKLIGSIQIRVRYRFQLPSMSRTTAIPLFKVPTHESRTTTQQQEILDKENDGTTLTRLSPSPNGTINKLQNTHASQHGHGDLARDDAYVNSVFKDRLSMMMTSHVPRSDSSLWDRKNGNLSNSSTQVRARPPTQKSHTTKKWRCKRLRSVFSRKSPQASSSGRRYGFSQNDADDKDEEKEKQEQIQEDDEASVEPVRRRDRIKRSAKRKAQHIISSVNFGDKNFAIQWLQDTFEEVASAHPLIDHLIGFVVSGQTQALVRSIIKLANSFGQGFKVTTIQLVKAMMVLQKYYSSLPKIEMGPELRDRALVGEGCHYFRYALIAYGWRGLVYLGAYGQYIQSAGQRRSNRLAVIRYLHLHHEDLLGYEYGMRKGAAFQPSYFVAIDRTQKNIVLSIRGTWSLYDAITDLVCDYMPYKGGLVHSGMLASAQWFYTNIVPQIFRYIHHHRHDLNGFIITGHSLGGGTASLLTMMVVDRLAELRGLADNDAFQLHCYSYAPVALSSQELGKRYDEFIHSFIVQDDIVGRLSYGTAMRLRELILDTISAFNTLGGFHKVWTDPKARQVCFDILNKRRTQIYGNQNQLYPLLHIPGKIIHIQRTRIMRFAMNDDGPDAGDPGPSTPKHTDSKKRGAKETMSHRIPGASRVHFTAHHGTSAISNEMYLTKSCLEDHIISTYRHAFAQLRANYPAPN